MRILQIITMKTSHQLTRSYIPSTLLYLFLVTFWYTNCLASTSLEMDGLLPESLNKDVGSGLDSLLVESHEFNLVTRQSNESVQLSDNSIVPKDINPGTSDFWTFSPSLLKVSSSSTLYITISVCTQPFPKVGLNATEIYTNETLPPLQLYISQDSSNPKPGPGSNSSLQNLQTLSGGFASYNVSGISTDVFLSVVAQNVPSNWQGSWSYQLGTSTKGIKTSIPS
jgi:hypothetical protein